MNFACDAGAFYNVMHSNKLKSRFDGRGFAFECDARASSVILFVAEAHRFEWDIQEAAFSAS